MRRAPLLTALLALTTLTASHTRDDAPMPLSQVRSFMYQLQNLEQPGAVEALAKSPYDLIVIEPTFGVKGNEDFDIEAAIVAIRAGKPGRLVIAYLDPCQAERFRTYWQDSWKPPKGKKPGNPSFLLTADPDGWTDDFNVAYWDEAWQDLFVTGESSEVRRVMEAGFDGVYLDWIDAFEEPTTVKAAKKAGINPAAAMVDFLLLIRQTAREINPDAIVIQQNAIYLPDADPRWKDSVDAVGVEDTWFGGKANAKWGSKKAGDIPNKYKGDSSTAARLDQYAKIQLLGKPVLTIDYCRDPKNAATVYTEARKRNLIPLVTQISPRPPYGNPASALKVPPLQWSLLKTPLKETQPWELKNAPVIAKTTAGPSRTVPERTVPRPAPTSNGPKSGKRPRCRRAAKALTPATAAEPPVYPTPPKWVAR